MQMMKLKVTSCNYSYLTNSTLYERILGPLTLAVSVDEPCGYLAAHKLKLGPFVISQK